MWQPVEDENASIGIFGEGYVARTERIIVFFVVTVISIGSLVASFQHKPSPDQPHGLFSFLMEQGTLGRIALAAIVSSWFVFGGYMLILMWRHAFSDSSDDDGPSFWARPQEEVPHLAPFWLRILGEVTFVIVCCVVIFLAIAAYHAAGH